MSKPVLNAPAPPDNSVESIRLAFQQLVKGIVSMGKQSSSGQSGVLEVSGGGSSASTGSGSQGTPGIPATISIGTVTTLPYGSSATVTNVGTAQNAILNFGIPMGAPGPSSGDAEGGAANTVYGGTTALDGGGA